MHYPYRLEAVAAIEFERQLGLQAQISNPASVQKNK
jgi:hypothetical protein